MLGTGLRWFKDMPCPSKDMGVESLLADASYALARAAGPPCGPVHLNFMYREPLAPSIEAWPRELLTESPRVVRWLDSRLPFTNYLRPYQALPMPPDAQLLPLLTIIKGAHRGLIVAGAMFTSGQQHATAALAKRLGWPVMPDVCSSLRTNALGCTGAPMVPLFDALLSDKEVADSIRADVILQVGGRLVSKRLQSLISTSTTHIMIEEHGERMDPSHSVTHRLQGDIAALLGSLQFGLATVCLRHNPLLALSVASDAAENALQRELGAEGGALSEPWVARHICSVLCAGVTDDDVLFASNSLPIRHLDMFCSKTPLVLSNRGASGIDGIIHTALGATLGTSAPCTLLIGDLAALHDLNALASLRKASAPLVVVVLNNAGGGIFRFLPIARHERLYSPYFDTPHEHDFARCCEGFGLPYSLVATRADFQAAFEAARQDGGPHVIEVPTDKEAGHSLVCTLQECVRSAAGPHLETIKESDCSVYSEVNGVPSVS
jgi:2-succinyl-5-enolpyruvyl-6-hydroxy-3-cyclohexene-1-carboxylate synthase